MLLRTSKDREVESVFGLLGVDENSASLALAWALEKSPSLRSLLLEALQLPPEVSAELHVYVQRHGTDAGFTDIEVEQAGELHLIIEAKRGWELPGLPQLRKYLPRLNSSFAKNKLLITLSQANADYAALILPQDINGIPVRHLSWGDVSRMAAAARRLSCSGNPLWLTQLEEHLQRFIAMDRVDSNLVYVVSLSRKPMVKGQSYGWHEVVQQDSRYFHQIGKKGWPSSPPNYLGFRSGGRLWAVCHAEEVTTVSNLNAVDPRWPTTNHPDFVYRLGPPMFPTQPLLNGSIWPNGRVWCAIDTLLSGKYATISDARDATRRRREQGD